MSDKTDMGGPAFPPNAGWRDNDPQCRGATLRDYYAAHTPEAYLERRKEIGVIAACEEYADKMLAARTKRTEGQS